MTDGHRLRLTLWENRNHLHHGTSHPGKFQGSNNLYCRAMAPWRNSADIMTGVASLTVATAGLLARVLLCK